MENDSKLDSTEFLREIRKLEVRLNEYLSEEEIFVKSLRNHILQLNALYTSIEKLHIPLSADVAKEISNLKTNAISSLSQTLKIEGKAEHEKSHLLESYSALILMLGEIEFS